MEDTIKKPKGRHSAPKAATERITGKEEPYAYEIEDVVFGTFKVLNTANGWWLDRKKVERLIDAYKIDANDEEACVYAGIFVSNLKYFNELHPDFLLVKTACHNVLGLKAKKALAAKVEQSPEWYLERKRKSEYSTRSEVTDPNADAMAETTKQLKEALEAVGKLDEHGTPPTTDGNSNPSAGDNPKPETGPTPS